MTGSAARILRGDVVRYCQLHKALGLSLFSAVLCDAPYGLSFMGKSWDHIEGIAFDPETWRAIADCLHSGAYLVVFAGNLNDDLISVAMRRAGLVKQHKSLAWANGSSLPKTTRIDTRIDAHAPRAGMFEAFAVHFAEQRKAKDLTQKEIARHFPSKTGGLTGCVWNWENAANVPTLKQWQILQPMLDLSLDYLPLIERIEAEREVVGRSDATAATGDLYGAYGDGYDITAPATPLAQTWAGHRYGSQALRNLVEAILIFRKPYEGKPYECIVRTGAGALNVAGSRIGHNEPEGKPTSGMAGKRGGIMGETVMRHRETASADTGGRHPANFLLSHTDRCIPRGTKRVRGSGWRDTDITDYPNLTFKGAGEGYTGTHYADADGLEEVPDFECHESCPVRLLDEQAGERPTGGYPAEGIQRKYNDIYGKPNKTGPQNFGASTGGPSRFVHCADWNHEARERIEAANAVTYRAKPSRAERNMGIPDNGDDGVRTGNPHPT